MRTCQNLELTLFTKNISKANKLRLISWNTWKRSEILKKLSETLRTTHALLDSLLRSRPCWGGDFVPCLSPKLFNRKLSEGQLEIKNEWQRYVKASRSSNTMHNTWSTISISYPRYQVRSKTDFWYWDLVSHMTSIYVYSDSFSSKIFFLWSKRWCQQTIAHSAKRF